MHGEEHAGFAAHVQSAIFLVIAALALFASAGTLAILGFWLYLAIFAAIIVASLLALDPDLFRERMRPGGQPPPLGLRLFTLVMLLHWVVAGLDRGRLHWSDTVPAWLQAVSLIALAAGYLLCFWAMAVNRFFSSVVRIQTDRGQHVVAGGPYLAGIVIILASGLALGSWLAALLVIVTSLPFLLHRAVTEDRVLGGITRLRRLRASGSLAPDARHLVR